MWGSKRWTKMEQKKVTRDVVCSEGERVHSGPATQGLVGAVAKASLTTDHSLIKKKKNPSGSCVKSGGGGRWRTPAWCMMDRVQVPAAVHRGGNDEANGVRPAIVSARAPAVCQQGLCALKRDSQNPIRTWGWIGRAIRRKELREQMEWHRN